MKLDLNDEQWKRLHDLAWEAMRYKNIHSLARWADMIGLRVPKNSKDRNVSAYIRKQYRRDEGVGDELSGVAYSAGEREVAAIWQRDGKRIRAGASVPQFKQRESLSIRGHKNRAESGVRLLELDGRFFADLQVQSQDCEGGCWMRVAIAKGTEIDEYQAPILRAMATGATPILKGIVTFRPTKRRAYLRLCFAREIHVPEFGARVATFGIHSKDDPRLLLRTELDTIDYTQEISTIAHRKTHWDEIRRGIMRRIGRRRGGTRAKRDTLSNLTSFDAWCKDYSHTWSHQLVQWCKSQGVGRLVILNIGGGDWPAHQFEQFLRYKGEELGIMVENAEAASLADTSTARAAEAKVKKRKRKTRELGDAYRTINANLKRGKT